MNLSKSSEFSDRNQNLRTRRRKRAGCEALRKGEAWRGIFLAGYFLSLDGGTRPFMRRYTTTFP